MDKFMKAAKRYLHLKDVEILGTKDRFIVFHDLNEDSQVFAYIANKDGYESIDKADLQHAFEQTAISFMKENDIAFEGDLRCDLIEFNVIKNNRAIVRHTINALN